MVGVDISLHSALYRPLEGRQTATPSHSGRAAEARVANNHDVPIVAWPNDEWLLKLGRQGL